MAQPSNEWKSNRGYTFDTKALAELDDIACELRDAIDGLNPSGRVDHKSSKEPDYSSIKVAYVIAKKSTTLAAKITKILLEA